MAVACSSFVFRLQDQVSFWAQRSMMIAAIIQCYKRVFSGVLEGVVLKNCFWGQAHRPPFFSSYTTILCCVLQQWAYVLPISVALGASGKLVNSSSPWIGLLF